MTLSRRKSLALIGGGVILAAGAGAGTFLGTRTPGKALKPWDLAGSYSDPRRRALSYALLAPSAHNRQPWQADLSQPDRVTIWRDTTRELHETDPYHRQLTISMGCFLELFRIAAAQEGIAVSFDLYPKGEEGPVAVATLGGAADPDPLFPAIMERRSCKEAFEDRAVEPQLAKALAPYATIETDADRVAAIRDLTWEAWMVEALTPRTMKESVDLMRFGKAEINASPDGIDLGGPFLESLMVAGMLRREDQADPDSAGFKQGLALYEEMLNATHSYAVITTAGNTRVDQIEAGRRWIRLNLATTMLGLALHPVSQALQEFPEMAPHYAKAHEILAGPGETVQMLGRLGYGPNTQRSPRWPLETRLI